MNAGMNRNASYLVRLVSIVWRRRGARHAGAELLRARRRLATGVGAVLLGLVALAFAAISDRAQGAFAALIAHWPYAPLLLTPALFAAVVWVTRRSAPYARGSGIPQVIAASRAPDTPPSNALVSLWTASVKFVLTVVMLLGGASVGREGPTVQISAAIMVKVHRYLRVPITSGVLIAGGAAGVAAAFNTPLASVAFAIEELAAAYERQQGCTPLSRLCVAICNLQRPSALSTHCMAHVVIHANGRGTQ